jgi:2-amino-4-hydroxy-6-hydroxymethyldihydropteridine diphosphokinase
MESEPWGYAEQGRFLNMAVELDTGLAPLELLRAVKSIEKQMGRVPSVRYGPRLIDIDILKYGDVTMDTPELTLPHPRMLERDFVMVPLRELGVECRGQRSEDGGLESRPPTSAL